MSRILIVDDDRQVCETMESLITRLTYSCDSVGSLARAGKMLSERTYDVVFLDINLPDGNGLDMLPQISRLPDAPEVIILTGQGDPDGAELAISGGAWDYLLKPSSIKQISLTLGRAIKYHKEKAASNGPVALDVEDVVGRSPVLRACFDLVAQAAQSASNVLLTGETGTGKELFARTIHKNSARSKGDFVVVDCAAMTGSLVESILFGHKKGAFTGAHQDSEGLVRQADGGTLFLDEVGELPMDMQKAFLRVLQERKYRPVGETQEFSSDFRLVSATNRDLEAMVERGEFRRDLLFRLKTVHINLPPLRKRLEDIKHLALHHLAELCERHGMPLKGMDSHFVPTLQRYDWPGNVRELFNVLERAYYASQGEKTIYTMHLPRDIRIKVAKAQFQVVSDETGAEYGVSGNEQTVRDLPWAVRGVTSTPEEVGIESVPGHGTSENGRNGVTGAEAMDPMTRAATVTCAFDENLPTLKEFKGRAEAEYLRALIAIGEGELPTMLTLSGLSRSHLYALLKKHNITM
jgi:two-component system NtrC family response regulator